MSPFKVLEVGSRYFLCPLVLQCEEDSTPGTARLYMFGNSLGERGQHLVVVLDESHGSVWLFFSAFGLTRVEPKSGTSWDMHSCRWTVSFAQLPSLQGKCQHVGPQ